MTNFIHSVVAFNQKVLGIDQRQPCALSEQELEISLKCLQEELDEFKYAAYDHDYIGQIDAIVDLLYFGIGVLYKLGLTPTQIEQVCAAVHEANMAKKLGTNAKRDTGAADAVKPEGWIAPEARIAKIVLG